MLGFRYIKIDPSSYVLVYKSGKLAAEGNGFASFCYTPTTSIARVPNTSDDISFIFEETTSDFQTVTVQGRLTYQVADAKKLATTLNFTVNLASLAYQSEDPSKISQRLVGAVKQIAQRTVSPLSLRDALRSNDRLTNAIREEMNSQSSLTDMGLKVTGVSIEFVKPKPETSKALEAETRESILKAADDAMFLRRNSAVDNERTLKENELDTEIAVEAKRRAVRETQMDAELAIQKRQSELQQQEMLSKVEIERKNLELVDLAVENKRKESELRLQELNQTMQALGSVDPAVIQAMTMGKVGSSELIALAFGEMAKSAGKIGNLTITPELLSSIAAANNR